MQVRAMRGYIIAAVPKTSLKAEENYVGKLWIKDGWASFGKQFVSTPEKETLEEVY